MSKVKSLINTEETDIVFLAEKDLTWFMGDVSMLNKYLNILFNTTPNVQDPITLELISRTRGMIVEIEDDMSKFKVRLESISPLNQ
jgi:hypothetical protein